LSEKFSEISKTTSPNGNLRDFFSLPQEPQVVDPESSTSTETETSNEPDNQVQSLFNEYYNSRKNFVIEYGY
jgi:hypothetical protein